MSAVFVYRIVVLPFQLKIETIRLIFGRFDVLTDKYGIYKVETVGDAYIAAMANWPLTENNSPLSVVMFALEVVQETLEHGSPFRGLISECASASTAAPYFIAGCLLRLLSRRRMEYAA